MWHKCLTWRYSGCLSLTIEAEAVWEGLSAEQLQPLCHTVLHRPGVPLQISIAEPLSGQQQEREEPSLLSKQCERSQEWSNRNERGYEVRNDSFLSSLPEGVTYRNELCNRGPLTLGEVGPGRVVSCGWQNHNALLWSPLQILQKPLQTNVPPPGIPVIILTYVLDPCCLKDARQRVCSKKPDKTLDMCLRPTRFKPEDVITGWFCTFLWVDTSLCISLSFYWKI